MNSSRPYLLRAFFEWILDNDLTPYLVVNAQIEGVFVPKEYVEDGRIILNISPDAVKNLLIANDHLEFNARFGGVAQDIYAPMLAITAIYAKENGRGMVFKDDEDYEDEDGGDDGGGGGRRHHVASSKTKPIKTGKPTLTIVK